jgi:hypothetical protein
MARKIMLMLALCLTLMACSKEPKTVSYYAQHEVERQEQLKKADENPGKFKDDPDVINAATAEANERNRKFFHYEKQPVTVQGPGLYKIK